MDTYSEYFRQLNFESMLLRIFLAVIAGGLIGFEREKKRRPAGFRTYMLVAVGATLTLILGQYLTVMVNTAWAGEAAAAGAKTDVARLGAQVINGVGFLGAGTIIVTGRQEVKGLTTAAGLWASACMGLAIGAGFYECMLAGFFLIFVCMNLLPYIEDTVIANSRNLNVYVEMDSIENLGNVVNKIKGVNIKLHDVEINKQQFEHVCQINVLFNMVLPKKQPHAEVLAMLSTCKGITFIEEV